ncbi:hypothetical protein [Candidatus Chlamydia sanziniae]|uniref:hypothetical protein n=1 Tax=Candidatus Chlamydia sanziniae TaxID=1806891 RepID=UPI00083103A6|nr:hypothetical protein [Candidatus Chlamydia sanziniae]
MTGKLPVLSLILKTHIYKSLCSLRDCEYELTALSQKLKKTAANITEFTRKRNEYFISRNNVEHYDSLLEHLKRLQISLYNQQRKALQDLSIYHNQLQRLVNRRKIIEKIKYNKYSRIKRQETQG